MGKTFNPLIPNSYLFNGFKCVDLPPSSILVSLRMRFNTST